MAAKVAIFVEDLDGCELFLTVLVELGHDGAGVTLEGISEVEHEGEAFDLHELGPWAAVIASKATEAFDADYYRLAAEWRRDADGWAQDTHWEGF
jgi:hypothetical protein